MANFFKRLNDILNANLNDLVDRLEDPERMIKQLIVEMEQNLNRCKEEVLEAIASEKRLLAELEQHRKQQKDWYQKAQLALEVDKEDLARSALARKKETETIIAGLEPAWTSAKTTSDRLKAQLRLLEKKLEEARLKRSTLVARQRASEARQQMSKTMDRFQAGLDTQARFERMEDKVADMEAQTAAWEELEADASPLEKEFLALEIDTEVEAELAALKAKVHSTS